MIESGCVVRDRITDYTLCTTQHRSNQKELEAAAHVLLSEFKADAVFFANPWIASMMASGVRLHLRLWCHVPCD